MNDKEKKHMNDSANDRGGNTNSQLDKTKSNEVNKKKKEPAQE
jgi:hypothetical protein